LKTHMYYRNRTENINNYYYLLPIITYIDQHCKHNGIPLSPHFMF
jgi:hypothetical protein